MDYDELSTIYNQLAWVNRCLLYLDGGENYGPETAKAVATALSKELEGMAVRLREQADGSTS